MKEWAKRTPEIASLLNPAFCSLIISSGLSGYAEVLPEGAPYVFPFVILPLVLHKPTRDRFPRAISTLFSAWITNKNTSFAKIDFAQRAKHLAPYVKEALIFGMQGDCIYVTEVGLLKSTNGITKSYPKPTVDVNDCLCAATKCGRWLAKVGDIKTVMALLGVKP